MGEGWAECSLLETDGWRETLSPSSLLHPVSTGGQYKKRRNLLSLLMPLQEVRAVKCLATVGVIADHGALLGMISLMAPTSDRQIELLAEEVLTYLRCSARVYDWRSSARTQTMWFTRSDKKPPTGGEVA